MSVYFQGYTNRIWNDESPLGDQNWKQCNFFSNVSKAGLKLIVLGFIPFLLEQLRIWMFEISEGSFLVAVSLGGCLDRQVGRISSAHFVNAGVWVKRRNPISAQLREWLYHEFSAY